MIVGSGQVATAHCFISPRLLPKGGVKETMTFDASLTNERPTLRSNADDLGSQPCPSGETDADRKPAHWYAR